MSLNWKVRTLLRLQGVLTKLGALPDIDDVLGKTMAQRTAMAAPKALLGKVPDVPWQDRKVPTRDGSTVRVRVYRPVSATAQPLLYLHGGGFSLGGIAACDHICKRLANETRAVIVSVEYRLAPDHLFPVPLHDCLDAADWLTTQAGELGVDLDQLVVAGDSAGGNLAAVLAVVFRDQGRALAGQLLIYPTVDLSLSMPAIHAYDGVGPKAKDMRVVADTYLAGHDATDPLASPWYADPTGLAPAFVLTVAHDPLHGEGVAYAHKLRAAGVPVLHLHRADHVHGSLSIPRLYDGIDDVHQQMSSFVRSVAVSQPA